MTAIVTPFRDGKVDEEAFRRLIDWQIEEGVNGLVPVGTTANPPRFPMKSTGRSSRSASIR